MTSLQLTRPPNREIVLGDLEVASLPLLGRIRTFEQSLEAREVLPVRASHRPRHDRSMETGESARLATIAKSHFRPVTADRRGGGRPHSTAGGALTRRLHVAGIAYRTQEIIEAFAAFAAELALHRVVARASALRVAAYGGGASAGHVLSGWLLRGDIFAAREDCIGRSCETARPCDQR